MLTALLLMAEAAVVPMPMPAFLAGCWEQRRDEDRWAEECWTSPRGGLMIGSGRTGRGDNVANWEWMRIERGADGRLVFIASPMGTQPVAFQAVETDAMSITFVNANHDYPQRIRYVVTDVGLEAEISLADGSKPNRWDYRHAAGIPKE